jgi:hypothetical protein
MRKIKLLIAVSLLFAAALAFSCSDDGNTNSGDLVSCKFSKEASENLCTEISVSDLENTISEFKSDCEKYGQFLYGGCPGGSVKKCSESDVIGVLYLYDDKFKYMTCSEILNYCRF